MNVSIDDKILCEWEAILLAKESEIDADISFLDIETDRYGHKLLLEKSVGFFMSDIDFRTFLYEIEDY